MFYILFLFISHWTLSSSVLGSPRNHLRSKRSSTQDEVCGSAVISVDGPGEITSPQYPNNYPSNANCRWDIIGPADSKLKMIIENLEIEEATDCGYDYLEISELKVGVSVVNKTRFCGVYEDHTLITNKNKATLEFRSDINYEEKGFLIRYSILQTSAESACNYTLTDVSGTVTSPGYPDNYPDGVNCWVKIKVEQELVISLKLNSLMLEHTEGQGCKYDFLRIYDGDENSDLIQELCTEAPKTEIFSSSNELTLNFRSDEFLNSKGYIGQYHAVRGRAQVRTPEAGDCIWNIGRKNGTIASPNFPKKYPSNSKCIISLLAPMDNVIVLKFISMSLEQMSKDALYDYVRIYDGSSTNSSVLGTFGGISTPKEPIKSSGSSMTIKFESDAFVQLPGFEAKYEFERRMEENATTQTTTTEAPISPQTNKNVNELLSEVPHDSVVTAGESYVMKCTPKKSTTTITWMKGQAILGLKNIAGLRILSDSSLSIDKMNEHLEGEYTCVALRNDGTTASVTVLLFIQEAKKTIENCQISFLNKPENKTLIEGEFAFLGCYMDGAKSSWLHNGEDISTYAHRRFKVLYNGYLSMNNVQESDSGIYTCIAHHNASGCVRSASSFVQVIKPANVQKICGKPIINNPEIEKPRLQHGKIVNGFAAKKGAYPWMAMIYTQSLGAYCGGSLINERWIISAAHCFSRGNIPLSDIQIKLGKTDKSIVEESQLIVLVEDIIIHHLFDATTYDNDIALIKLKTHVTFTNFILPICLGTSSFQQSKFFSRGPQMGTATGWGRKWEKGPKARVLLEVVLPIVDQSTCTISTKYTVTSNMFCAGYALAGAGDTCKGDSGGPFVMKNDEQWYLVGVTSWGEKCSESDKYGYYTKVSNYVPWVHHIIGSNGEINSS